MHSLRARIIFGSLLWTLGLLAIGHTLSLLILHHLPRVTRANHPWVLLGALAFMAAGLSFLLSSLSAFAGLRERLSSVRKGQVQRVEGRYPNEIQPLVNDLNTLLVARERAVSRALTTAGDLAHGLKTPLALLTQDAERAAAAGHHELAAGISQQVDRMRRLVDYHLAHARAAASGATPGAHCSVSESLEGLVRTVTRLYAERNLIVELNVPANETAAVQREDLDEMLGDLLDNAAKWARSRIAVTSSRVNDSVIVTIDDDGPGLAASLRAEVLKRGVRADEAAPGSGLGLAIVRDLAELYGGFISLGESPLGGLKAKLTLPE